MNSFTHWVFGYGSLLWNPGFRHQVVRKVFLPGWSRRMWQGSTDHRGTPEYPGLVCTLIPDPEGGCWGLAYAITDEDWDEIRAMLDFREKDGYELHRLPAEDLLCWTYVARESNPSYIGDQPLSELALRIHRAIGPSGSNREYLTRLQQTLLELDIDDPHVTRLMAELEWLQS